MILSRPLLPQECPAVVEPSPHNDPPLLLVSVSQPEIGQEQEQQIKVSVSLPVERDSNYLWVSVTCVTQDNLRFGGATKSPLRHSEKGRILSAYIPGFTGGGGTCKVRVDLSRNVDFAVETSTETQFRLSNGYDPGKQPPRLISEKNVTLTKTAIEHWENQDPALSVEDVKELHKAAEGMKKIVMRLHGTVCDGSISEHNLLNTQQNTLAVIRSAREHLLKNSEGQPSQALRIQIFTHDLEERLLELNLTNPSLKTGAVRERPAAFNPASGPDHSEISRRNASALLHEVETIWDALTDVENTKLLYVALEIKSCPTHSKIEYGAKGYPPETDRTDKILHLTKARIHFKVSDPTTAKTIDFDRDLFRQPERRVAVWCKDDPTADEWYVE